MNKILGVLVAVAIGVAIAWYIGNNNKTWDGVVMTPEASTPATTTLPTDSGIKEAQPIAKATYDCDGGKIVKAEFYKGETVAVNPGEPPVPTGKAKVSLSDGRNFDLAQTISADGGRYANNDESFVFWDKGDNALLLENGVEKDYTRCINRASVGIKVISPNGGEVWAKGQKVTISWSAPASIKSVNVRLAIANSGEGQAFNAAIVTGTQNTGIYEWTVQDLHAEVLGITDLPVSDKYIVTVEDADDNSVYDTSDAPFGIK